MLPVLLLLAGWCVCSRASCSLPLAKNESVPLVPGSPFTTACTVDPTKDDVIRFTFNAGKHIPRITTTTSAGVPADQSIGVFAAEPCGSIAWDVPLFFEEAPQCSFPTVSRFLCPSEDCGTQGQFAVTAGGFSSTQFNIKVEVLDISLRVGDVKTVTVTPSKPVYFHYVFEDADEVNFHVTSSDPWAKEVESTISLQTATCPVYDLPRNIQFEGKHQTMTTKATLFARRKDGSKNGLFAVIIIDPQNDACMSNKTITVSVTNAMPQSDYFGKILILVASFLVPWAFAVVFMLFEKYRGEHFAAPRRSKFDLGYVLSTGNDAPLLQNDYSSKDAAAGNLDDSERRADAQYTEDVPAPQIHQLNTLVDMPGAIPRSVSNASSMMGGFVPATGFDNGSYDALSKYFYRAKVDLRVSDLTRKLPRLVRKKFRSYIYILLAVCIFYAIPVTQLVLGYLEEFNEGREDVCYYNFGCQRPLGSLKPFNNVMSNLGYVILGALFLVLVRWRSNLDFSVQEERRKLSKSGRSRSRRFMRNTGFAFSHSDLLDRDDDLLGTGPEDLLGLPRDHGIFYAVGISLICEGVFSACYHICPTATNFQFDTAFMYIISSLLCMALYQRRHSDTKANATTVFGCFAGLITLNVIGVYGSSTLYYIILVVAFAIISYFSSLQLYYVGQWKMDCAPLCMVAVTPDDDGWSVTRDPELNSGTDLTSKYDEVARAYDTEPSSSSSSSSSANRIAAEPGASTKPQSGAAWKGDGRRSRFVPFAHVQPLRHVLKLGIPAMCTTPLRRARLALVVVFNFVNWCMMLFGVVVHSDDTSTFFLGLLILNLAVYSIFYICMKKFVAKEKLLWLPTLSALLAASFWGVALFYFTRGLTSWTDGAAVSREGNQDCMLLDFYDSHDFWHMLSAFGLFFSCIALFTLDDDLVDTRRSEIAVF